MNRDELNDEYFEWMYHLVCNNEYSKKPDYRMLLNYLHNVEFTYIIDLDGNRAEDGEDLRYRFGYEFNYPDSMIASYLDDRPCSILEMMVALAIRCEENIMDDPDMGNRTGQWLWSMIVSLGLGGMHDEMFDEDYVNDVIYTFLNREYDRNGEGSLFTIDHSDRDMRGVEIWCQMNWYLSDILNS